VLFGSSFLSTNMSVPCTVFEPGWNAYGFLFLFFKEINLRSSHKHTSPLFWDTQICDNTTIRPSISSALSVARVISWGAFSRRSPTFECSEYFLSTNLNMSLCFICMQWILG